MKNDFSIKTITNPRYVGIVFCNNYHTPVDYFDELDKELANFKLCGYVLFDLLLVNGMSNNRYAECYFDGNRLDINRLKVVSVDNKIANISHDYFIHHNNLIENSILTRAVKFRFKKKLAA